MRKGKHEHTCPQCLEKFYGRLNRTYCGDPCKRKFNNEKNRRENAELKIVSDIMKNCRNILKDKFEKYGHTPFPIDELFNAGFDKNVPIVKLRIDENEKEWIKICEFGVFIKSETREVEIIKIK